MSWFYNLNIGKKLILTFLSVISIVSAICVFSIVELHKVNQASTDISTNWLPTIKVIADLKLSLARVRSSEFRHILTKDEEVLKTLNDDNEKKVQEIIKNDKKYVSLISEPEERVIYAELSKNVQSFVNDYRTIIELSGKGDKDAALAFMNADNAKIYNLMLVQLDKLSDINNNGAIKADKTAEETFSNAQIWIISLLIACIVVSMLMAIWVSRIISKPLNLAVMIANQVATGDLTADIQALSKDETGQLMLALQLMNTNLKNIVTDVRNGTDTIATASSQISSGNLDLSSRTEQQASSLEETAAAIEELTSTVQQNANNTREAKAMSVNASTLATNGGEIVNGLIDTMNSINDSSKKIVDIISVIDSIAFQTNILALNAAVEAARAGEQGRGFAVVASEVRNLAQKSATAAKEIKALISDSVAKVNVGTDMVAKAGNAMKDVVSSVNNVTVIIGEIATASHEQSTGIAEVNTAIMQMDQVTQQNAALVEEAAAASMSLQEQADKLSHAVSVFKLQ